MKNSNNLVSRYKVGPCICDKSNCFTQKKNGDIDWIKTIQQEDVIPQF